MLIGLVSLLLLAAETVPPATAAIPAPVSPTITVIAPLTDRHARRQAAIDFVNRLGIAAGEIPAARFEEKVCPRAYGLADTYVPIVEARLRAVAAQAGARVAAEPCRPNIFVNFVADGAALARSVDARSPRRLAEVPTGERAALLHGTAPLRWWYATETRSKDGMGDIGASPLWAGGQLGSGGGSIIPTNGHNAVLSQYRSSIISTDVVRVIKAATVVVDITRAEGATLDAVVDHAAMVGLAEIRVAPVPPPDSILGLFRTAAPPAALTPRDLAALRALYRLPLDREARQQRGLLVRGLLADPPINAGTH